MTDKREISMEKLIAIFNQIAMIEGYSMVVNEVNPLRYFSSIEKFYSMIDKLIEHYVELEEYEKCPLVLEAKKKHGWKGPEVIENK